MTTTPIPISDLLRLTGKTAIVTGGAVGIGYGIAYRLAEAGANVVVSDLNGEGAEVAAKQLTEAGFEASAVQADVSQESDVRRLIAASVELYGDIDILVNNAGIFPNVRVLNMEADDFTRVLNVNVIGVFLCTKLVAKHMIERSHGGRIINITSIDALHPSTTGLAHYDASKHGVWGFTKNVALELAPHQIWVNAIAPGGITTPGVEQLQEASPVPDGVDMRKTAEAHLSRIPMARMGDPDEIGKVTLFLASDLSSYMTGSQIVVDGGLLLS